MGGVEYHGIEESLTAGNNASHKTGMHQRLSTVMPPLGYLLAAWLIPPLLVYVFALWTADLANQRDTAEDLATCLRLTLLFGQERVRLSFIPNSCGRPVPGVDHRVVGEGKNVFADVSDE